MSIPHIGEKVRVHFEGLREVPESALRAVVEIDKPRKDSGVSNREVIERDTLLVQAALYDLGYVQSKVLEPKVEIAGDGGIDITYRIEEGSRFRISKISVRELDDQGKEIKPLEDVHHVKGGDWMSRKIVVEDIMAIRTKYGDAGYAFAEVEPQTDVDVQLSTLSLVIAIKRGPVVSYRNVKIEPEIFQSAVSPILKQAGIVPGAKYNETKLVSVKGALAPKIGIDISTTKVDGKPDRIDVSIEAH